MALTTPDLTLPPRAPTERYQDDGSYDSVPAAVYILVDLGPGGSDNLIKALEADDDDLQDTCRLAPTYDFVGHSLRAVYEYHLEHVAPSRSYHSTLFIAVPDPDYKTNGVLLVNLDVDLTCRVEICRIGVDKAATAVVNLAIANMDWEEIKQDELPSAVESITRGPEVAPSRVSHTQDHPAFAAYDIIGANLRKVHDLLEPGWAEKAADDNRCRPVCTYEDPPDPWQEMIEMHPWCCYRAQGTFHPQLFICVDRKDVEGEGVLLVKMDWDGNIDRDPNELIQMGTQATIHTRRCPVAEAIATLTSIATGERAWEA